ncbi:MAG: hypothetical protein JWN49_280 [Parcubacteria group bacterium]|nr:hypothetical protein [Parcubacteria group bacterium]
MKKYSRTTAYPKPVARGFLMLLALVFGSIFVTVLAALSSFSITQNHVQTNATGKSRALALAEAGLEYYRWFLAHNPGNLTNGTGQPGPYVLTQTDPEGGTIGTVSLNVSGNMSCGQVTSIDLTATGYPSDGSNTSRTVATRYAQPTVATYSYILNDSVWAGSDRIINGPYHSNGGIRMDGTANAPVTSSLSSWLCTDAFGCSTDQTKTGVFGAGPNSTLWSYPSPQVDFNGIAANFTALKTKAQASGIYLARYSSGSSSNASYWRGYHLIFNADGTVTVKKVSNTQSLTVQPINTADGTTDHTVISSESTFATYTIPSSCGLIFVEDNVWVEGVIPAKVTVVSANVTTTGVAPNIMLPDNITYSGSSNPGLTAIAENDVLVTGDSPSTMALSGIFIAQNGAFGRNYYGCPSSYEPRNTLTIHGTTVSNKRTGTKWMNGCSGGDAGYQLRTDAFDRNLATDPPPFTPTISTDYQFVDWHEQ